MSPSATPSNAANSTCRVGGRIKVMVCAGYQNNGIVFLKTTPHCTSQLMLLMIFFIGMGFSSPTTVPPVCEMWMSVHLWKVIITGAKMVFMATLTQKAMPTLPHVS